MIRTVKNVKEVLDNLAKNKPKYIAEDMVLKKTNLLKREVVKLENQLNLSLPKDYKQMILTYDFSSFEVGSLRYFPGFSRNNDLISDLITFNSEKSVNPYLDIIKKNKLFKIGDYEGDLVCVSLTNGKIYLVDHETIDINIINSNFTKMVICGGILTQNFQTNNLNINKLMKEIRYTEKDHKALTFWRSFSEIFLDV